MLKIWGKIMRNNKIVMDDVVSCDIDGSYQDNLKQCILELCYKFDIEKPYWLPANLAEYNKRSKTSFNENNFIETINFDKFVIEEIGIEDGNHDA